MSTDLSKRHVNQLRYADAIYTTVQTHHATITAALAAQGLESRGVSEQLQVLAQNVRSKGERLRGALAKLTGEAGDDDVALRELETASRELLEAGRFVRERILTVFGAEWAKRYAVSSPPVGTRAQLLNWSKLVLTKLEAHPRQAQDRLGAGLDTQALHGLLKPLHDVYAARLDHYAGEQRETQDARRERDERQDELRIVLTSTALIVEGYLRLAKLNYHADRIRPTIVRTRGEEPIVSDPSDEAQEES